MGYIFCQWLHLTKPWVNNNIIYKCECHYTFKIRIKRDISEVSDYRVLLTPFTMFEINDEIIYFMLKCLNGSQQCLPHGSLLSNQLFGLERTKTIGPYYIIIHY